MALLFSIVALLAAGPISGCLLPWEFEQRVVPHHRDGRHAGFKVVGVRPDSALYWFGVRSGDVLRSVSGTPIVTGDQATDALVWVGMGVPLALVVERHRETVTITRVDGEQPAWWFVDDLQCIPLVIRE